MLYLAETQKKNGFMGSGKAEFKLLAAQRSEHDWSGVPGEELVAAPDDAPYASGVLVLIELTNSRQVQRHQEAGRTLVSVLQNFSSMSKKSKAQSEEIEQWKESLTYQSQALNRREMEIETRQDQVEQAEADLERIEQQRQEVEAQKGEVEQMKDDLARKNAELEGAWAHLNGELRRFEESKESFLSEANTGGLSEDQSSQISAALTQLAQSAIDVTSAEAELGATIEQIAGYRASLAEKHQLLAQKQDESAASETAMSEYSDAVTEASRAHREAEAVLHTTQIHLQQQQAMLGAKQEQNQLLTEQLKNQTDLHQRVYELLNATDKVRLSKKVDVPALEAMDEPALQSLVTTLEQDLDKMVRFVNDQEEELRLQQEDIDALKAKLTEVSDYDRLQLETEIAEEKDCHVMLNRTLVGQRRNLLEREEVLSQHRAVLLRRQGLAAEGTGAAAELEPILDEIDKLRADLGQQIQQVEAESAQIQSEIDSFKRDRQQQKEQVETRLQALSEAEATYAETQQAASEAKGQVTIYEALLAVLEESLDGLSQKVEAISSMIAQIRVAEANQQSAVVGAQQVLQSVGAQQPVLV